MKPLTPNMRTALLAISEGRSVGRAISGRGRNVDATLVALGKRGLLRFGRGGGTMGWEITDAGRDAVASLRTTTVNTFGDTVTVSGYDPESSESNGTAPDDGNG